MEGDLKRVKYRLYYVLNWSQNIFERANLPSLYFITNTKHSITYLALTQLFPVLLTALSHNLIKEKLTE